MKKEEQQYRDEKEVLNVPEPKPETGRGAGVREHEFSDTNVNNVEPAKPSILTNQEGRMGYLIAWMLGVPAWILLMVFLIRGH